MKKTCTYLSKKKTHLLAIAFLLFSLTGFAQTNYYVAPTGNNANNGLTPATAKLTLQHTVSIAADGSIIHLANGTYTLTTTLNFNHELTIIGESEAGVIINATGIPASAWALNPNRSNTSLSNFTLLPNGNTGGFPVHVGANSGPPLPVISNIHLSHITINGAKKTAFDFNAVNDLSISFLTATNTTSGNGVQLSGCWNVNASNIITSGNAWGGLAVYVSKPYPSGTGRGSNNINIDASNSFAEIQGVYNQDESGFFNTNIAVNGYDYAVQNTTAVGYTYYFNSKTTALAFAAALPNPAVSSVKQLSTAQYIVGGGMTIQAAVNAAPVNSVVNIEAGTYHEDVTINKPLSLQGAGMNSTTVSGAVGGGGATFQISANGVLIDGFSITRDGNAVATWNDPGLNFAGIAIQTAGNAEIRNCKFFGNRTAIDVNNSNGNNIHNNIITDNRSGLLFRNRTDQTRVTENFITNNWTIGILFLDASGGTNVPVQSAANSTFSNNDISGNWYAQIADRQTGGALPAAGNNLKNFSCNWYGSIAPIATVNNTTEPGYAAQVPVAYGGSAVAPGGQPDIAGSGSVNFTYQPYLANGSDNDVSSLGFQPAPNSCRSPLSNVQVSSITNVLCNGSATGVATISFDNGVGVISYSLDGSAAINIASSPFTINGLAAGAHTIIITDGAANTATVHVAVSEPVALTAHFTFTPILCNGGLSTQNVTITGGTAPYGMFNQGGGAFVIGASEGVTYGGTEGNTYAANYVYTVTDANGCQYVFEASITQPAALVVALSATPITCNGNSVVTVSATGGKAPYTGTGTFTVNAGTYSYTVTDANGCSSTSSITPDVIADTEKPTIVAVANQSFCNGAGMYTIPVLTATDICSTVSISYTISGATTRSGNTGNASGLFNTGQSTINWIAKDVAGNTSFSSTMVTITALPTVTIAVSNADAFCNKLTLIANTTVSAATYKWTSGNSVFATTQQVSLGQSNGDGNYQVTVTAGGCTSAAASYNYQKQNLISSYTILAFNDINLGTNNIVASGSIGVTSHSGEVDLHSNSSVSSPGSFVKAKKIDKNGSNIQVTNPIYSAATGIVLPTMFLNNVGTNNLPNKDVAQNSVSTVNGNYKNLTLKKGSRTTLTGNTFGTIRVEQGAQVIFTATTINIDKLQVVKGPRYGYSYLRFAPDTKILVSTSVSIGSQVYINPDNYKVTFYMGDKKSDEEKFTVNGGDTKVTANIYVPNGKLKVTGGYSYGNYGNGFGDCDRDDDDERYYGQGSNYVNMTGLFIAEEVEGNGKNVIWNSFDCNAAPVPVLNAVITQLSAATKENTVSEEELKVTVLPNPSTTYFTLKIESKYPAPVNLRVIDSRGRVVDARTGIGSNSTIQVGHGYAGGTYYAEMVQGGLRKVVQLIKQK
ncbi:MAG: right-handed parallel beta-helix repeat-containing protein [Bacteroidota bacterium]